MGKTLYTMKQSNNQSVSDYLERFKDQVDIIDDCGGSIGLSQIMITSLLAQEDQPVDMASASTDQYAKAVEQTKQQYLAFAFISGADDRRYGKIRQTL